MKKLNNRGFSALELLLILLLIAIIGGVGYYVYNAQKDAQKTQDKTKTAQSEQVAEVPQQDKYLEIKQWGVRFKLNADAEATYYKLRAEDETADYADIYNSTFDTFKNANGELCKDELLFVTSRYPKETPGLQDDPFTAGGKVIGNYYFVGAAANQAPPNCYFLDDEDTDKVDTKVADEFAKYKKAVTESYKSLEATP